MGGGQLEAGNRQPPARAAGAKDDFVGLQPQPTLGFDGVRIDEARGAGLFVDRHPQAVQVLTRKRMGAHIVDDLADAREQPGILEHRLAHGDAVLTELASLSNQPGSMGQCPHRNRSVIGRHAAKLVAGHERRLRAQVGRTARGDHTGRSSANDDDLHESVLFLDCGFGDVQVPHGHAAISSTGEELFRLRTKAMLRYHRPRSVDSSHRAATRPGPRPLPISPVFDRSLVWVEKRIVGRRISI